MRLLILGGTLYLGRHLVEAAIAREHDVTLFNRGQTHPELFADLDRLRGDRDREEDLAILRSRRWDAAIDTSGYLPRQVRAATAALRDSVPTYVFVSSISVYADDTRPGLTEDAAVAELPPGTPEELGGETYGALKARCERVVGETFPGRVFTVRPGLIVGPHDPTDRSSYWPRRMARGGVVLAPGRPDRPIQLIDARDLAEWMIHGVERGLAGVFNATGPERVLTMEDFLAACGEAVSADPTLEWVDEEFLLEHQVAPYSELPLWVPERHQAFGSTDSRRALAAGLAFRPLVVTLRDIREWERNLPPGPRVRRTRVEIPPGLAAEREAALLAAWKPHLQSPA